MQITRRKRTLLLLLLGVGLTCFAVWFMQVHYVDLVLDHKEVSSEDGIWDLTDVDFEAELVSFSGRGETILDNLLTPEEFNTQADLLPHGDYTQAPVSTTRMRILLPDDGTYMLIGESIDYADRFYLNGILQQDVGQVGMTEETSFPGSTYFTLEAKAENGVLEIVRQSSNFHHRTMRDPVNLRIGTLESVSPIAAVETNLSAFVMGMFLVLFLCHGLLYAILRRYKANLYFSLLCLSWSIRLGVTSTYPFSQWFPHLSWDFLFRIEYTFVAIAAVCIVFIIAEIFSDTIPSWLKHFILVFSAAYLLLCLFTPTKPLSYLWVPCAGIYILAGLYIIFLLTGYFRTAVKQKSVLPEQWIMLISFLIISFTATHDVLYYNGLSELGILNGLGFLIFAFFQMVANLYGTLREIDDVHKMEQDARLDAAAAKKASQMQEEFLHTLSHELQMPITVVSGFSQLTRNMLEDEHVDRVAIHDNMLRVEEEAERMERMVGALLDTAAMENGTFTLHRKQMDMHTLIYDIVEIHLPVMNKNSLSIVLDVEEDLLINGDRERLLQVLLNLLSNALKHTERGSIVVSGKKTKDLVRVRVKDTGSGISPELLSTLFQRFAKQDTTKGNGLGLYICRQIIEAHGGHIEIESEVDVGTIVGFSLPQLEEGGLR